MSGHNSGLSPNVVKTALDTVFDATFSEVPKYTANAENPLVFMQDSADKAAVITEQFMGSGYWDSRSEQQDVPAGTVRVGNQKTFSVAEFGKSIDISKNLYDDDQHSTWEKMVRNMARNARLTRDKNAFGVYAGGFSTYTTNDGVNVFSASHVNLNGDTVDNTVSGALSDTTLETGIVSLIEQKTQDGTLGGHEPAFLLVSPALFKEAVIYTKSELRPTTANNDLNYVSMIYPGLQVLMSPFLGAAYGGSDTAWFLGSREHSLMRWVRQAIQTDLVDYKFQRNNNYIYKGSFREVVGPISYEGLVGSTGV